MRLLAGYPYRQSGGRPGTKVVKRSFEILKSRYTESRDDRMARVFISSSSDTLPVATKLASELDSRGFETMLLSGESPAEAIASCDAFLVLIGPNSERSAAQEREWVAILDEASGFQKRKKLIPLVVDSAELPNFLKNWQSLTVPGDEQHWPKFLDTIIRALRSDRKPKVMPISKADLKERKLRLDSIATVAKELKGLGL
jgi:hypothetical protein